METKNFISIATNMAEMNDDELATGYILANKMVPILSDKIVKEMVKRNIGDKLVIINNEPIRVEKQPKERLIDTKENDLKKILIHCLKNNIDELFNQINIKQSWLDEQKWYDHSFYENGTKKQILKPYKIRTEKI